MADVMAGLARELGIGNASKRSKLQEAWIQAVGEPAASHTKPIGVKRNVLTVKADSSVWVQELGTMRRAEIITALGTLNTGECIRKLKIELA